MRTNIFGGIFMNKLKVLGLKILTLFLLIVGILFLLLAQVNFVIGTLFHRFACSTMKKYSYDYLEIAWNNMIDDAADAMDCCKKYFLTAKIEL